MKKLQASKENEDFILSTLPLLQKDKYDFLFYLLIFLECFSTKCAEKLLSIFHPQKIKEIGKVSDAKIKKLNGVLNNVGKNPERLKVEKEESRKEITDTFYFIYFYFNVIFHKDKIKEIFQVEKIFNYMDKIYEYQQFISNIILPNEVVCILIEKSKELKKALSSLYYLGKNCLNVLEVINSKKEDILKLINEEADKNNENEENEDKKEEENVQNIELEKYILPKSEDNLLKMSELINEIIAYEQKESRFIDFSPATFEEYIKMNINSNLENLNYLNQIINSIKKVHLKFQIEYKIDNLIHETALELIKKKKFTNLQILDFISKDDFYNNDKYKNDAYRNIDVFDGIDITSLNDEFFKKWNEIDFFKMFEEKQKEYSNKIGSLINDMKDFKLLFKLFKIEIEKNNPFDYIDIIKQKYLDLYDTYDEKTCKDFFDNGALLICIYEKKQLNTKKFLKENIHSSFTTEHINNIYIKTTELYYKYLSKDIKAFIVDFFLTEKNNSNPSSLAFLIKQSKNLRNDIFSNIDKYKLDEEDFFVNEEADSYKFYKGLVDYQIFEKDIFKKKGIIYIERTASVISSLANKLELFELKYGKIYSFFKVENDDKLEKLLFERIKYVYLLDKDKAKKIFDNLKSKVNEIKDKIEIIECIFNYFNEFFKYSHSKDIEKLGFMIVQLRADILSSFELNYKNDYDKYIEFYKEAKRRIKQRDSSFFNNIFKRVQSKIKDDEVKCLETAEKEFNEFKKLFKENDIEKIDQQLLEFCIIPFKEDEIGLKKEINSLVEIFEIKEYRSLDMVFNDLLLISKKEHIYNIANSINSFLKILNPKKTSFQDDMNYIIKSIQKNDIATLKKCKNNLEKYKIKIDEKENKYIDILIVLGKQPESFKMLLETSIQDCRNLQELSLENDNNFISVNDILDMEKCIEFFLEIGKLEDLKSKEDIEIINLIKENSSKHIDILLYFQKYLNNYNQIIALKGTLNKSEFLKYQIHELFDGAIFYLSNNRKDSFIYTYKQKEKNNQEKKSTRENIISLKERAQLAKKITSDYKCFIECVTEIINISNILENLCMKGYPKNINIKIVLNIVKKKNSKNNKDKNKNNNEEEDEYIPKNEYYIDNEKKKGHEEIIESLKIILLNVKKKQIEAYETKKFIRFIYGRQFNILYDYFNKIPNNDVVPLLKFITNDLYKNEVKNFNPEKGEIIESNINNCERFLNELLKANNLKLENVYQNTLIKGEIRDKYKGLHTFLCEKLEKDLFQIYKYLTGHIPIAQNILLCNKNTTNEEITVFLYRAIKCEFSSCFIVGGIELLEFEQKSLMIKLIEDFFQNGELKPNSCLIILYTNKLSDIYRSLEMKKYKIVLNIKRKEFENEKYEGNDIEIIKSDKSGVGKSTQIKKEIEDNKKKWIYFPFGGVFTREDIIKRLKELNIDSNCVLHIDLYDTDQTSLMMDFLFSILITRFYGQNEDIFYLSKDIKIKIEIPNSFIDFFLKFPILTLFNIKEMKISNLCPLIVPKNLDSNIQIVANYLKSLKEEKINNYDLIFPNITPEDFVNRVINVKKKRQIKTSLPAEQLPPEVCQQLIFEVIKKEIPEPTYYQIMTFIDVLAVQLKKLNKSFYLNAFNLMLTGKNINPIRTFIVESFIKITNHFTKGAFTELLKKQEQVHKSQLGIFDENNALNNAVNVLADNPHEVISYDKIDPSLLFFHEGEGESFSIITNKKSSDQEYINLLNLKNSQAYKEKDKLKYLPKYNDKKFGKINFLKELKEILDIKNPVEIKEKGERVSLEEIAGNYVFTADNFVKMILILLRIRSNIPVIMMGETGCGKTSLIRKLSEMKNNGESNKMKILNIHAGTNENDIIDFINNKVIPDAKILEIENEKEIQIRKGLHQFYEEKKIWVFLDEINTCKSMGLLSELMCKHTCQGKPLPKNIVFIAACNPYRKRESKGNQEKQVGLDINYANKQKQLLNDKEKEEISKTKNSDLVYTVNPLPHSLLNFVFDFGSLTDKDEEDYIRCIIKESLEKIYFKNKKVKIEDKKLINLKQLAGDMIIDAHKFIRGFSDKSAVSLREIRRFNIFYEFFYDYLIKKKVLIENDKTNQFNCPNKDFYIGLDDYLIQIYAVNLSVFVCYYLRITDKDLRKALVSLMNENFRIFVESSFKGTMKNIDFLELPMKEENFIVDNIKLGKGIAKNRALLENIFSLFVAINQKVPIFIVGKPGCSKSLSFQLLNKSMQGITSDNSFFKNYPKLMVNSYQGSMASTSKGVENIFRQARTVYEKLDEKYKKNNISMIYFDEMGLAEHSPNNPLKVIHSALEYDENEGDKKVAFVGISNWILDASKMNRGISISIPEPNREDNIETSLTIGKSYNENLANKYNIFFQNLGLTYFNYKKYLKEKHNRDGKEDFHGNRDFYHLVKNAAFNMDLKEKQNELNEIILPDIGIYSIERNFSGIQFDENKTSLEIVKDIFKNIYPEVNVTREYNVLQRIKDNINDLNSRYLLVISKSSISNFLLSSILSEENKEFSFYIGSKFKSDLNNEEYALKVLNKIQTHMENGNILIMKDLGTVYPSMFDLFNQNFTVLGNKNYARLAIGSSVNTFSFVNDNFRCIVDVSIDKINDEEAPFLNRFEKHIMSFEYLLNKDLIDESQKIKSTLDELIKYKNIYKAINYDLSRLLINCNIDEIQALMYKALKEGKNGDEITNYILSKISLTLPQDIIISMIKLSNFKQKKNYYKKILEFYGKGVHTNLASFLKNLSHNKNVVYTFSNGLDKIENIENINNKLLGDIKEGNITYIKITSINDENELEKKLDEFFNEDMHKVCIIQFMPYEGDYMNYVKYLIENKEKDYKNTNKKCFIFMVYMSRILQNDIKKYNEKNKNEQKEIDKKKLNETLSYISEYYQIFIDNLNGEDELYIEKIAQANNNSELIKSTINVDNVLCSNILTSISYLNYTIFAPYKGLNKDNYIDKLIKFITKHKRLRFLMNECIFKNIEEEKKGDIIDKLYKDKNTFAGDEIDIISVIKKQIIKRYCSELNLMFFKAEKEQFFSSLLTNDIEESLWKNENEDITLIEKNAKFYLDQFKYDDGLTKVYEKLGHNKVDIMFGMKLPGIKPILDRILIPINEITKNYRENENDLRTILDEETKDEDIKRYFRLLNLNDNSTVNIIKGEEKFKNIIENNKEEKKEDIYNLIINDYFSLFINKNLNTKKNKKEEKGEEKEEGKEEDDKQQQDKNEEQEEKIIILDNYDDNKKLMLLLTNERNEIINSYFNQNENKEELDIIKKVAKTINFVESYAEEISSLHEMFIKLNNKTQNLIGQMENIIENKQIQYEISKRNPEYISIVNKAFFLYTDSILRVIISNDKIYDIIKGENADEILFELIHIFKEILQISLQLDNNLNLRSKESFSMQEILKLFDAFTVNKSANIENLKTIIQYFGEETKYNNEKNSKKLCSNLNHFYKFLMDKLGNNKKFNFYKTLSFIFLNEYIKITFEDFREELLNRILEKKDFIKSSSQIIRIILENVIDSSPLEMMNNLENIKEEEDKMFRKLNNTQDEFLDEVILNIFERKISIFFEQIPELDEESLISLYPKYSKDNEKPNGNLTGIVFDNSLNVFKDLLTFLDDLSSKKDDKNMNLKENIHLAKLFAIAYIKMYLSKAVFFIKEKYNEMGNCQKIIDVIKGIKNKAFCKVIKIYVFKLFYNYMNKNYEQFKNYNYKAKCIDFTDDFETFDVIKDEALLTYFFLPSDKDDYDKYIKEMNKFEIVKNDKFNTSTKSMAQAIEEDGLDIFLLVSINKIISNLGLKNYMADRDEYQNFSSFIKSLFQSNLKINPKVSKLLYLFYDEKTFVEKTRPKLIDEKGLIDPQLFEIILYGFIFCFNTLYNEENGDYLYKSILNKDCTDFIDKSFIPGIDILEFLHLITLDAINDHFNKYEDGCGCYVCSCGYYYSIGPCGFPTKGMTFKCPECKKDIGYGPKKIPKAGASNHGMVLRKGHYRIFKNAKQKTSQMSRWNDPDENIPNLIYNDYIKMVIDPLKNKNFFGFIPISRDYFENQNKTIRKLSKIGYRLLNFISYCHLFFSYCLEFINKEKMKKYLIEDMSILKIIQTDWKLLEDSLKQKNIGSIQIFMNMIFKKLSKKIRECKFLKKSEERENFEVEVEKIIEECIKNYPNFSKDYNEKNKKQLAIGNFHMKTIVTELVEPTEENYPKEEYPLFKYFIFTKYKSTEDFEKKMENPKEYALTRQLLKQNPDVLKLVNLQPFNEFTNFMVDYYSFKISRDDSKKKELDKEKDNINKDNNLFKTKFDNFIKAWNNIKKDAIKYQCRPEMPPKPLTKNDKLIYYLTDNGELYGGMYLAAACQNFIEWQNTFLQPIVDVNNNFNGILHHYVDNIEKRIPVQSAKYNQILLIEQRFLNSNFMNLNDLIYSFSERKIFGENGKINYTDYNSFEYDYESIEEELGKIILPGVCLFDSEKNLNFVTFWSEGFRGEKSQTLSKFYLKYPQKDLDKDEKENIINYIDKMNRDKMERNNIKYDFKEFFGSLQILIFYLTERVVTKKEDKISDILKNPPPYLKVSADCTDFFLNDGNKITINKLMNLFFFFEHLCFEDLAETVQLEYRKDIPDDIKKAITDKLINNYKNDDYTLKDLGAAVRRFISRYLAGKIQTTEIKEDLELPFQLSRTELWEEKIGNNDNLSIILNMQLKDFNLKVQHSYAFYELIGNEDKKSISALIDKKDEQKKNQEKINEIII